MNWIKVSDRLPDHLDIVPVVSNGDICYALYVKNEGFLFVQPKNLFVWAMSPDLPVVESKIEVSHWMLLPPSPKD